MEERLQKIIASCGGVSRRGAEALIEAGKVTVNGQTAVIGSKADIEKDEIVVDGNKLKPVEKKYYIMLNKPVGYVTSMSDEQGRHTVNELVADIPARIYPVGRLDLNSEGLLLMTNDGEFANRVMHPAFEKNKTYRVLVSGDISIGLRRLTEPMQLDGNDVKKPDISVLKADRANATVDITIHEGRNRQIRRMCEIAGLTVKKLTRISIGNVRLGKLHKSCWRHLTDKEVASLMQ